MNPQCDDYDLVDWKPVHGFPGLAVSWDGRFFSWQTGEYLNTVDMNGRRVLMVRRDKGKRSTLTVSRVVFEAFIRHVSRKEIVVYRDGNPGNVCADNLESQLFRDWFLRECQEDEE